MLLDVAAAATGIGPKITTEVHAVDAYQRYQAHHAADMEELTRAAQEREAEAQRRFEEERTAEAERQAMAARQEAERREQDERHYNTERFWR